MGFPELLNVLLELRALLLGCLLQFRAELRCDRTQHSGRVTVDLVRVFELPSVVFFHFLGHLNSFSRLQQPLVGLLWYV